MRLTLFASLLLTISAHAGTRIFETFEGDGLDGWQSEGKAFGVAPVAGKTDEMKDPFANYANESLAASTHGGDAATGTLTSPEFVIAEPYIGFLIAGGSEAGKTAAQLVIDGKVVLEATGKNNLRCGTVVWDVRPFKGATAKIRLVDDSDHAAIGADQFTFTDYANPKFPGPTREGKPFISGLTATPAIPGVQIPPDTLLKIVATHAAQGITSPTALTFDDEGRIYVSETHRFRHGIEDDRDRLYWYLDDLASKTTADRRALHEKWKDKASQKYLTEKSEIIRRLADTDGDGVMEESKVYADGFNDVLDGTAAGVFYYDGFLYFACIPKIYMLRDTNGDGAADERKVVADGFGVRISLSGHDLNGFTLGPDGKIYGSVGDRGLSLVTKEGVQYMYPNEGVAFRFEPDGTDFEIFHTGLRNPKEIAFDAYGNAITVDNNSDQGDQARVVYLVDGGDTGWQMEHQAMHTFHRQIGLTEHPPSRWMDERMWDLENPSQPAYILPPCAHLTSGPSGLTYHPGAGFLESEKDRFLICDYRGGAANSGIWSFAMSPQGAGMKMTDARQFAWGIAATDVEYSWDGKLYITDFISGWTTHEDGRVLSLDAGAKTYLAAEAASVARIMKQGFEQRSSAELANLLKHPDARVRLRAQIALTRKSDAVKRFTDATLSVNPMARIHGIWGLGIVARRGSSPLASPAAFGEIPGAKPRAQAETTLVGMLKDEDPEIRAQALKVLGDVTTGTVAIPLGPLLVDPSSRVRFFAAILAGKRKQLGYYGPICDMLRENNNRDVYLRHAGIFALENMANKPFIISALDQDESPAVRLAATVALRRMNSTEVSHFVRDADPQVADEAIRAVCDTNMVSVRPQVATWLDELDKRSWTPFMLRRLIHNSFRLGDEENAQRVVKVAMDEKQPEIVRKEALRLLAEWTNPFPVDQLTGQWHPLEKREPSVVQPALSAALPELLKQGGYVLTAALGLVERYNLDSKDLGEKQLQGFVSDATKPAAARAKALELMLKRSPKSAAALLPDLTKDAADEVAVTALEALVKKSPDQALPLLESALTSGNARARKAWDILAKLSGDAADNLFARKLDELRAKNGIAPDAIELMEAARGRKSEKVTKALADLERSLTENPDPLAKWNPALEGGDPESGAELFRSNPASECMRCHRAEEGHAAGGETAPNLAGVATRHPDRKYFLESMLKPSAVIAPGFGTVVVDFKNGASLSGNVIEEAADHVDIDAGEKTWRVRRNDIESLTPPTSPMPPMGELLKPDEIRDLIAWLATLTRGGESTKTKVEPTVLDPATLPAPATTAHNTSVDPAVMKTGRQQFMICGACHGQSGEGTSAGPPLAGSEWVNGPIENLIRIQLRGLQGSIQVKGQQFQFPAGMAPLAYQSDEQIAAVLTYVRNSFGNTASAVDAAEVTKLRPEAGKPQIKVDELVKPEPPK